MYLSLCICVVMFFLCIAYPRPLYSFATRAFQFLLVVCMFFFICAQSFFCCVVYDYFCDSLFLSAVVYYLVNFLALSVFSCCSFVFAGFSLSVMFFVRLVS